VVGPVINTVGVGGSALMGKYRWLTSKHGMTLDNIVYVEIVLTSGEIVHFPNIKMKVSFGLFVELALVLVL
jgi:FAD/FMN-containing dehydrogenase